MISGDLRPCDQPAAARRGCARRARRRLAHELCHASRMDAG